MRQRPKFRGENEVCWPPVLSNRYVLAKFRRGCLRRGSMLRIARGGLDEVETAKSPRLDYPWPDFGELESSRTRAEGRVNSQALTFKSNRFSGAP